MKAILDGMTLKWTTLVFQQNEDCEHLFWRCCHVQHICNNLIKYLSSKGLLIELTFEIISFEILDKLHYFPNEVFYFSMQSTKQNSSF